MNEKTMRMLEFDKVLSRVKHYANSDKTKSNINLNMFSKDIDSITRMIEEVDQAMIMLKYQHVELAGITDTFKMIKAAEIGSPLTVKDLNQLKGLLYRKKQFEQIFHHFEADESELPSLTHYIYELPDVHYLYKRINETIDDTQVLDHASDELLKIRKKISNTEGKIRERLNDLVRTKTRVLSDRLITMRNNRYVVPVKVEYRSEFKGIVHDMSQSGQTVYMEPMAVVEMSNTIQSLKEEESIEVLRILHELSSAVAEVAHPLRQTDEALHALDLIFAKAKYGQHIGATKPEVTIDSDISLPGAFHPLIEPNVVVKNDIHIGHDYMAVIITGPNTGGKTVTLKTVGLSVLMAQSGIPIPCRDGGRLRLFHTVYGDIGDEQSIEQSLSTFSSHMTNITSIVDKADEHSLVLLDELGAGTDPEEGAALAISILEHLLFSRSHVMATTHYPQLKSFSYTRDDIVNASVEFDVHTLSPTYRLLMHIPGKSNAFEISNKLGLNPHIVNRARELIGRDSQEVNEMIEALERHTTEARENDLKLEQLVKDAEALHSELSTEVDRFNVYKEALRKSAREKINRMVKREEAKAQEIIAELEVLKQKGAEVESHKLIDAKKSLNDQYVNTSIKSNKKREKEETIEVGDSVDVLSYGQKGEVIEVVDKEAVVQMGIIKMKVPFEELKKRKKEVQKQVSTRRVGRSTVGRSLDLRGERYEDALIRLDNYLDQVILSNYQTVEIIHGKGTGALQKGVQDFLKRHKKVQSYRGGMPNEGGFGVTIVEMK